MSSLDFTLAPGWLDLALTGAADHGIGNAGPNVLIGSSNPDRLEGLDGDDTFHAATGFWSRRNTFHYDSWGPDTLIGGRGNDWYDIDWNDITRDTVVELPGEGIDTVEVRGANRVFDLADFPNVENLVLQTFGGPSGLRGDAGPNRLIGNSEFNWIDGGAGDDQIEDSRSDLASDADTLLGGSGNDDLTSRSGRDLVDGGPGDDTISLEQHSYATIAFGRGSGADRVHAVPLTSFWERRVSMGTGIAASDLQLTRDGTSLRIGIAASPADSLTWIGFYADATTPHLAGSLTAIDIADGPSLPAELLALRQQRAEPDRATTASDVLLGAAGPDLLSGLAGDDLIDGSDGADDLRGGPGNDTLYGGNGSDTYRYDRGDGVDLLVDGHGAADTLVFGSGIAPADVTIAVVDHPALHLYDMLTLQFAGGTDALIIGRDDEAPEIDTVRFADGTTWNAATLLEEITGISGSPGDDSLVGGDRDDRIFGLAGNDTLLGGNGNDQLDGGPGSDQMRGGDGDDHCVVDAAGDAVLEDANRGYDTISSSVSYVLGNHIEVLKLTGTAAINATGNTFANRLEGNPGANLIDGGAGADTMAGGAGDDSYKVDHAQDQIIEAIGEGTDHVTSGASYTLAANVENLTLSGTSALNGHGNELANLLIGNSGNNRLEGGAGDDTLDGAAGNDTLVGGTGNDSYLVGIIGDSVVEAAGQGIDTVLAAVAWTLGDHVENLTLTGSSRIKGTGNALANRLTGNAGANLLTGLAGADTLDGAGGNDTLVGGAGADTYLFGRGSGVDLVQENDATAGVADVVMLEASLTRADLRFARATNNLEMSIAGTADKMVFQNWYLGTAYHAEAFRFSDGSMLNDAEAQALVGAMAVFGATATGGGGSAPLQPRMTIGTVDLTSNVVL